MQQLWLLLEWQLLRVTSPVAVSLYYHYRDIIEEVNSCQMIVKVSLIHVK